MTELRARSTPDGAGDPAVRLTVDGSPVAARAGESLLEALRRAGWEVPTLCHVDGLPPTGACRLCVVEVEGARGLVTACSYPVRDGLVVRTHTPAVLEARRQVLELLLANHPPDCLGCVRSDDCELRQLAARYGARPDVYRGARRSGARDGGVAIVRDTEKCVLCGRCVQICHQVQGVGAIDFARRGFHLLVAPAFEAGLDETACVHCGQCVLACPTGALHEADATGRVWHALADRRRKVAVQVAPAVRVSVGEAFGAPPGSALTGQLVAALRRMGFWRVFDTNFGADLTVMEEAAELIGRLNRRASQKHPEQGPEPLPLLTSCCPAWVKFLEHHYPGRLCHLSSCRSPHEMVGAVIKGYVASREAVDPRDVFVVSVMPCTAKKYEATRPELDSPAGPAVDAVLTTRELVRMLKAAGINPLELDPEPFYAMAGESTGAGAIFGSAGGVAEAALRTAIWMLTGKDPELESATFSQLRGWDGVRVVEVSVGGRTLRCATASSLAAARRLLESPEFERLDFIEVMACPGGCVNGGGQLRAAPAGDTRVARRRARGLQEIDRKSLMRFAHQNREVKTLYREWLGRPGSPTGHRWLHTQYVARGVPIGAGAAAGEA